MKNKPIILAINTTTRECSVALLLSEQRFVASEYTERGHDGIVLGLVGDVLKQAGINKSEIELLAFGRGPGAFTGIRVATAVTQGLGVGLKLKVVPVSDLANVAYQHYQATDSKNIAVSFDARMGEVYRAVCRFDVDGFTYLQDERLSKPDAWAISEEPSSSKLVGVGNGFIEFPHLIEQLGLDAENSNFGLFPTALATAELAVLMMRNGFEPVNAVDALPVYLRNDVAHKKS